MATVLDDGTEVYGEVLPPEVVVASKIIGRTNDVIKSINIEIVDYHHSIVTLKGDNYEVDHTR